MRTATMPPPALPSTSIWSSSACIASILVLSSAACFIRPRKSAMVVLSGASVRPARSVVFADVVRLDVLGEDGLLVERRLGRHHVAFRGGRRQLLEAFADRDDLRARELRQHRLHQRVGLDADLERGAARLVLLPDGG